MSLIIPHCPVVEKHPVYGKVYQFLLTENPSKYFIKKLYITPKQDIMLSFSLQFNLGIIHVNDVLFNNGVDDFDISFNEDLKGNLKEALLNDIEDKLSNGQEPNISFG